MDIFGYHLPSLAASVAAFGAVYTAFAKFDADQSDENRKFVRGWLLGLKADDRQWSRFFTEIFAKAFGARHFSLKCFGRSAALSTALVASVWVYGFGQYLFQPALDYLFLGLFARWIVIAIFADYFSLWKTRFILTRKSIFNSSVSAISIVVFDALATLVLFVIMVELQNLSAGVDYIVNDTIRFLKIAFSWPDLQAQGPVRLLFFPPLFTSAWLWIYLLVAYSMRAINRVPSLLRVLSKVMDFQGHPVRTVGYVAASASAIIVGIFTII